MNIDTGIHGPQRIIQNGLGIFLNFYPTNDFIKQWPNFL